MRLRWRRRRPPASEPRASLEIRLERGRYAPGETVRGSVIPLEDRGGSETRVWLSFHERSTEYEAVRLTIPGELIGAQASDASGRRFAIELPPDAPPSHTSRHGELWWAVVATGADQASEVIRRRIEVQHPRAIPAGSVGGAEPGGERRPDQGAW